MAANEDGGKGGQVDSNASAILDSVQTISTSHQWSLLTAVLGKVNRKTGANMKAKQLGDMLVGTPKEELRRRGIWVESFGAKYMPIICVNPGYGRLNKDREGPLECTCGKGGEKGDSGKRYFGSHDYNAGRHAAPNSTHLASCPLWAPPSAGHLHSWRRGYEE
mmetsp:Transcript_28105/g.71650  ORF Transcript_28105/g.71650 Transcript_28105/m.71650 type:complete len:163 (-) Transcript_28105:2216-2704(-)|eukprot:CAMPEP_0113895766 /NCGR_PEP_ID=MMETSP0780_2-20120614/17574_1 /TAXON_ID=652834 /ORGANISM="Palpitomonas bilix" /LENGTH=162 /DNA_ID=CAMNT_0000886691 /DNA_START=78 /DNA_END=566 /DNA_ORIENTATION=+ /assembly_acc=CAM_ASM_000599